MIEIPRPIETVCLQSCMRVELLDVPASKAICTESTDSDWDRHNQLLSTYNFQDADVSNRLQLKIRSWEGQRG